jgi:hypothetical protein
MCVRILRFVIALQAQCLVTVSRTWRSGRDARPTVVILCYTVPSSTEQCIQFYYWDESERIHLWFQTPIGITK